MSQVPGGNNQEELKKYELSSYSQIVSVTNISQFDSNTKAGVTAYLDEQSVFKLSRVSRAWHNFAVTNQSSIRLKAARDEFKALQNSPFIPSVHNFLKFYASHSNPAQNEEVIRYILNPYTGKIIEDPHNAAAFFPRYFKRVESNLNPFLKAPGSIWNTFYGRFPRENLKSYLQGLINRASRIIQKPDWSVVLEYPNDMQDQGRLTQPLLDEWIFFVRDMQLLESMVVAVNILSRLVNALKEHQRLAGQANWQDFLPSGDAIFRPLHCADEKTVVPQAVEFIQSKRFLFNVRAHPRILLVLEDLWCLGKSSLKILLDIDEELQQQGKGGRYLSRLHEQDLLLSLRRGKGHSYREWYKSSCYSPLWTRLSKDTRLFLEASLSEEEGQEVEVAATADVTLGIKDRVAASQPIINAAESKTLLTSIRTGQLDEKHQKQALRDLGRISPWELQTFLTEYFQSAFSVSEINKWFQVGDIHSAFAEVDGTCKVLNLSVLIMIGRFFEKTPGALTKEVLESLIKKAIPLSFNICAWIPEDCTSENMRFLFSQIPFTDQLAELLIRYYVLVAMLQLSSQRESEARRIFNQRFQIAIPLLYGEFISRQGTWYSYLFRLPMCPAYQGFFSHGVGLSVDVSTHYRDALQHGGKVKPLGFGPLPLNLQPRPPPTSSILDIKFWSWLLHFLFLYLLGIAALVAIVTAVTAIIYYLLLIFNVALVISLAIGGCIVGCCALGSIFYAFVFDQKGTGQIKRTTWQYKLFNSIAFFLLLVALATTVGFALMTFHFWGVVMFAQGASIYFFEPYLLGGAIASFLLIFMIAYIYQNLKQNYFSPSNVPVVEVPRYGIYLQEDALPSVALWHEVPRQPITLVERPQLEQQPEPAVAIEIY